jgi:hypothetical protein
MNISGVSSYERTCGGARDPFQNVLPFLTSVIRCRGATATSGDLEQQKCSDALYRQSGVILNSRSFALSRLSAAADHAFAEVLLGDDLGYCTGIAFKRGTPPRTGDG